MPINSKHPDYLKFKPRWEMIYDVLEGEDQIKERGVVYLPKLQGQTPKEYDAYKDGGTFYNAFAKTVSGFVGTMMRKPLDATLSSYVENRINSITIKNNSLREFVRLIAYEVLSYGRCGVLGDKDGDKGEPYLAIYNTLDIWNWDTEIIEGKEKLILLVLRETIYSYEADDTYKAEEKDQLREFKINDEGYVEINIYQENKDGNFVPVEDPISPAFSGGEKLEEIPFQFIGINNDAHPDKPALLDMVYINIGHWKQSVDHAYGLHYCALPTPWAAGFPEDKKLYVGPKKAWISVDPQAQCGYLEFTGQGLKSILEELERKEYQMAALGARMLERPRKGVETAEAGRIRQSAETASLITLAINISEGVTKSIQMLEKFAGVENEDTNVSINMDFLDTMLGAPEIQALLKAVTARKISLDTFLYNLKVGELLPPDRTIEDEKDMIETESDQEFEMVEETPIIEEEEEIEE